VIAPAPSAPVHLGFLGVRHEAGAFAGGYLVTNAWGRPLEFRMSAPVQPNRVQQILYAATLEEYLCGEVIGKTLVEKTGMPAQAVFTDTLSALSLRRCLEIPVAMVGWPGSEFPGGIIVQPGDLQRGPLVIHPDFPDDAGRLRELLERVHGLNLLEPFTRIREAIVEARKLGVLQRAG
jgi:hypothetical protein